MSTFAAIVPIFIIFFLAVLIIPGIYVYRDAQKRGMNAALWLAVVLLVPAFIGFLLYLLARSYHSDLQCPKCGESVEASYASCPYCGTLFKAICPVCSFPVERDWKVCPHCASPLSSRSDDFAAPVQKKDRWLAKVVFAVLLVPLMLFLFAAFAFSTFSASSGSAGITSLPAAEYLDEVNPNEAVGTWLKEAQASKETNKAYILRYTENTRSGDDSYQYLIYWPELTGSPSLSVHPCSGLFGNTLEIHFTPEAGSLGNTVLVVHSSDRKIRLYRESQPVEIEIQDISFPVELPRSQ